MQTLLVNCHHDRAWIEPYIKILRPYSEVKLISVERLRPSDADNADAIVVSGSKRYAALDDIDSQLIQCLRQNKRTPMLGICYGHQVMAKVLGCNLRHGELIKGTVEVHVLKEDDIFRGVGSTISVEESHNDHVVLDDAFGGHRLANSTSCDVEAFRHNNWFGLQFHPERSGMVGQKIVGNFYSMIM